MLTVTNRQGVPITSVEQWHVLAPPAHESHWQDGRSAKELAKAWIGGTGAFDLATLLSSDRHLADLEIRRATAEAQTAFDSWPGGRRNHDLLVEGTTAGGSTVIGLEAKADETYGQTVEAFHRAAAEKVRLRKATNAPQRLKGLLADLVGTSLDARPDLCLLRYQLFSAIAGTLAAAKPGQQTAFVVHEFNTSKTTAAKRQANANALARFLDEVFGVSAGTGEDPWLVGPRHVPAKRWSQVPLWIGHLTTSPG